MSIYIYIYKLTYNYIHIYCKWLYTIYILHNIPSQAINSLATFYALETRTKCSRHRQHTPFFPISQLAVCELEDHHLQLREIHGLNNWLVVDKTPWKIWKSIGMMTFHIYGKIKVLFQSPPTRQLFWSSFTKE